MNQRQADQDTMPTPPSAIVVGLDDSPSGRAALTWAAQQCRTTGWPLRVVHAWQMDAFTASAASVELMATETADARARATRWVLDTLGETPTGIRWSLDVEMGHAGQALVARAKDAHLLVVGTQEHTGVRRAVLGSVSHYCLTHAVTPVVAVPAPQQVAPAA